MENDFYEFFSGVFFFNKKKGNQAKLLYLNTCMHSKMWYVKHVI